MNIISSAENNLLENGENINDGTEIQYIIKDFSRPFGL